MHPIVQTMLWIITNDLVFVAIALVLTAIVVVVNR